MSSPNVYDTLGKLIDGGFRLSAHCHAVHDGAPCNNNWWLDIEALAVKLGRDHGTLREELVPKLHCLRCGSKNISVRLHPPIMRRL